MEIKTIMKRTNFNQSKIQIWIEFVIIWVCNVDKCEHNIF